MKKNRVRRFLAAPMGHEWLVNLGGGQDGPARAEGFQSPHVQAELAVVEHRLVGVFHEEARVLHDVPLEDFRGFGSLCDKGLA